jgi:magnesium-transporting ATPase (P-type)
MVAAEALGSCTYIASDKTGTLTMNELTVRRLVFPEQEPWEVTGEGRLPEGHILTPDGAPTPQTQALLERLAAAVVLCNEAWLAHRDGAWVHDGDAVDVALLVMAYKAGVPQAEALNTFPLLAQMPFESERQFAATLHQGDGRSMVFVKGALERLLPMCTQMATPQGDDPLHAGVVEQQALALAAGSLPFNPDGEFSEQHLQDLTLLGLVAMLDPLRPEAKAAVVACRHAGLSVAMVTGDHPLTALAHRTRPRSGREPR